VKAAIAFALSLALLAALPVGAQNQKKGSDQTRSVQGTVTAPDEKPVSGAVVQLKNTKTLQIRSFLTKDDGTYYFHGLSPDIDYELTARTNDAASGPKTLSSFDSRKEAVINLKLNPGKK
jgi:Carboxypeptidase regulatory-like domain